MVTLCMKYIQYIFIVFFLVSIDVSFAFFSEEEHFLWKPNPCSWPAFGYLYFYSKVSHYNENRGTNTHTISWLSILKQTIKIIVKIINSYISYLMSGCLQWREEDSCYCNSNHQITYLISNRAVTNMKLKSRNAWTTWWFHGAIICLFLPHLQTYYIKSSTKSNSKSKDTLLWRTPSISFHIPPSPA